MTGVLIGLGAVLATLVGGLLWIDAACFLRVRSQAELRALFDRLARSTDPKAHLFAFVRRGPESLQFHRRENGHITLEYPQAEWSRPYLGTIRRMAKERGRRSGVRPRATGRVRHMLVVDFGDDIATATEFAWTALWELYAIRSPREIRVGLLYVDAR